MNNTLSNIIAFTVGVAIGSAVTWKMLDAKYARIAQEEIDSVKETYARLHEDDAPDHLYLEEEEEILITEPLEKPDIREYAAKLQESGYTNYSEVGKVAKEESVVEKPYTIAPEEFGELEDYETVSLTYYADGVLADDMDEIVDNVDDVVGADFADHFGEYEDDSVFIRNDRTKCDYEILLDVRKYEYVVNLNPHRAEE
jgi:hypothetical protein